VSVVFFSVTTTDEAGRPTAPEFPPYPQTRILVFVYASAVIATVGSACQPLRGEGFAYVGSQSVHFLKPAIHSPSYFFLPSSSHHSADFTNNRARESSGFPVPRFVHALPFRSTGCLGRGAPLPSPACRTGTSGRRPMPSADS